MQKFDSISHFLQTERFEYRIFDMGRKVLPIENTEFEAIENQQQAYPYPFQQKALLALLFWPKDKEDEAVIWFLQFPIDELGYLKQQSRDAFLIDLLEQTGKNIQAKHAGGESRDQLSESPFAYKPPQDKQAIFHALATKVLGQQASRYYDATREYLKGTLGFDQWQFLGIQGIADLVARLDEDDNQGLLAAAIADLPNEPLKVFAQTLEHVEVDSALASAIKKRIDVELQKEVIDNQLIAALIRGLSRARTKSLRIDAYSKVLSRDNVDIEVLVAISGRAWPDLLDKKLLHVFMQSLAQQAQMAFDAVVNDLIKVPDFRELIMQVLQAESASDELQKKAAVFLQPVRNQE